MPILQLQSVQSTDSELLLGLAFATVQFWKHPLVHVL